MQWRFSNFAAYRNFEPLAILPINFIANCSTTYKYEVAKLTIFIWQDASARRLTTCLRVLFESDLSDNVGHIPTQKQTSKTSRLNKCGKLLQHELHLTQNSLVGMSKSFVVVY